MQPFLVSIIFLREKLSQQYILITKIEFMVSSKVLIRLSACSTIFFLTLLMKYPPNEQHIFRKISVPKAAKAAFPTRVYICQTPIIIASGAIIAFEKSANSVTERNCQKIVDS